MKFLHTADVHLDSPLRSLALRDPELSRAVETATRAAFARIVEIAVAERVAALLIAGDLFDGAERSARTAAFLTAELNRLRAAGIRVFYVKGNHDAENPVTGALDLPDNVHVFDGHGGKVALGRSESREDVWIHGVSFAGRQAPESLLPRFSGPVAGAVNIAMLHTSLAGAAGHDDYAPCSTSELAAMGFDYWALGHVHRREIHSRAPWIVMPGTPQGRDIGEAGPKSATMLTIEDGHLSVEEIPTSQVEFRIGTLDVTDTDSDDALRARLRARLREEAAALRAPLGVLRLILRGAPPHRWRILRDQAVWAETAADMARETGARETGTRETGALWLEKLVLDLDEAPETANGAASAELGRLMAEIGDEPGFAAAALGEVESVLADLPPASRARLMPDEAALNALTARLTRDGATRVLARMRGSEG